MTKSILSVGRWVLGLEVLACLGPLTVLWVAAVYVVGTTQGSIASVWMPTAIATVGPVGLLLAVRAVVMRRAVPGTWFAVLAVIFGAMALLQVTETVTETVTVWFAFDWRVWLLNSILPGVACAHLALLSFSEQQSLRSRE